MNFSPTQKQLESLADSIGARDAQAMLQDLQDVFAEYESRRRLSRDAHPTAKEALKSYAKIEESLSQIIKELVDQDESMTLAVFLSQELDQNNGVSTSFVSEVVRLRQVVQRVKQDFEKNESMPFELNGEKHCRRTRIRTRDNYLIPALMLVAIKYGDSINLDRRIPAEQDWESVDAVCEFLTGCMSVAGIPVPDAGNTHNGEEVQGRLRRMVKEEAQQFAEILGNGQNQPVDK